MNIDIRNIDFENPSKELIFDLCMGDVRILYGKYDEPNLEIDRVAHRDLLVKYDLQSFSELLVNYMGKWFQQQDSMLKAKREIFDRYYHDKVPYKLKVAKILKMFISGQRNEMENLEVSVTVEIGKINIVEPVLINQVNEMIINEFKRLKLNETELSREEAIEEILECDDQDWMNEYTDGVFYDGFHVYIDKVPEELLEWYMFTHFKPREITLDLVDKTIKELEKVINDSKEKPGAKIKNLNLGELARRLSYLHGIQLFLNQKKTNSIKDLPLSNETCRFIYAYFDFWNLLHDHINYGTSRKENRVSYIKALVRNNNGLSEKGVVGLVRNYPVIDINLHRRIDLFRKAHQKEITHDEFEKEISPFIR